MKPVISDDLKQHMTNSPKKDRVWLNDAGEWSNHKDAKFPHEVKRDEILGAKSVSAKAGPKDNGSETSKVNAAKASDKKENAGEKNTKDAKIKVLVTAENKKEIVKIVPGVKAGDEVEIDNPDFDPLA